MLQVPETLPTLAFKDDLILIDMHLKDLQEHPLKQLHPEGTRIILFTEEPTPFVKFIKMQVLRYIPKTLVLEAAILLELNIRSNFGLDQEAKGSNVTKGRIQPFRS